VSSVPLSLSRGEQQAEVPSDAGPGNRCVGDQCQALSGAVVDHGKDAQPTARNWSNFWDAPTDAKSTDERWLGAWGTIIGARVPKARLRPPRRRTPSRPSRYSWHSRLWFTMCPSCFKSAGSRRYPGTPACMRQGSLHHALSMGRTVVHNLAIASAQSRYKKSSRYRALVAPDNSYRFRHSAAQSRTRNVKQCRSRQRTGKLRRRAGKNQGATTRKVKRSAKGSGCYRSGRLGSLPWMPPLPEASPMSTQAASSL
jgi:hypothetical protein